MAKFNNRSYEFRYFRIYRDTNPAFEPMPENMVQQVVASGWSDPTSSPWNYNYKVTAVDFAGNESEAVEVVQTKRMMLMK